MSEKKAMDCKCGGLCVCGGETAVSVSYKYDEDKILEALKRRVDASYEAHYATGDGDLQCWDAWVQLGSATTSARDVALKYLWRYGQKNGADVEDLFKAMHFIMLAIHDSHYRNK